MATPVATEEELRSVAAAGRPGRIVITANLSKVRTIGLAPGQTIEGASPGVTIRFIDGVDGIRLSANNVVTNLRLETAPNRRALFNGVDLPDLGTLVIENVVTIGRVRILGRNAVRSGRVEVKRLRIEAADALAEANRPTGYGVTVLQGAFTLWNMQGRDTRMTADLEELSVGRSDRPVLGSGVFVGGSENGGLDIQRLVTGEVHSDGRIPAGTFDLIAGGVFVVSGCHVNLVENRGPVTTHGVNDMALDNWGKVDRWEAQDKVTTLGASAIGFVNFGTIGELLVQAPIETFGQGARGFNMYAGSIDFADFDRIVTHADGAVGVQISQPIGTLVVRRGIQTQGGVGGSLVKGQLVNLAAIPLSIKPGGRAKRVQIAGGLRAVHSGVPALELNGSVDSFCVDGGLGAGETQVES